MSAVDLSTLRLDGARPMPQRFGGVLRPETGGPLQTIQRRGDRWAFSFTTPRVDIDPEGRRWGLLLDRAALDGGFLALPLVATDIVYGALVVRTPIAGGRTLKIAGAAPGAGIVAGAWVSVQHGGRRYLDRVRETVIVAADGTADVVLLNLLRTDLAAGDVVRIGNAEIEGSLEDYEPGAWELDHSTAFAFTIAEDA